jgi:hypothetical protein
MQGEYAINGTHGSIWLNGELISEVQSVGGRITIARRDIFRAGSRSVSRKAMTVSAEGTIGYIKVTSRFVKFISEPFRDHNQRPASFDLRVLLDDPESLGNEEIIFGQVKFWEVPFGFTVNDIIEESVPFTAETMRFLDTIEGDPTISTIQSNYVSLDA